MLRKKRTFVIGDIHGSYKALLQCLCKSGFNYKRDTLICLGDVCDGWGHVKECIAELLKIKNLIMILGNHDLWTLHWMKYGAQPLLWIGQGGKATQDSYGKDRLRVPQEHIELLEDALPFYKDKKNRVFVHGGFDPQVDIEKQHVEDLIWDRNLMQIAKHKYRGNRDKYKVTKYKEVFIGHTSTYSESREPVSYCEVICLDQGCGWHGKLSIMNVDTHEFWQSDRSKDLYPEEEGRR